MYDFTEVLIQRWRSVVVGIILVPSLFICLAAPVVHAYSPSLTSAAQSSYSAQDDAIGYDGPNVVTDVFTNIADSTNQAASNAQTNILNGVVSFSSGVTKFDKSVVSGTKRAATLPFQIVGKSVTFTGHVAGSTVGFVGHTTAKFFGLFHGVTHLSSVIHPAENSTVPTITQLRSEQVAIIQKDTKDATIEPQVRSVGGACDNGHGNGGYPASWCDATMDSMITVPRTSSRINRECTSYAYWYFTDVEGHADFKVSGDAKYWAQTTNYPTHSKPVAGAIGVETGGTYGHVVIVQALPGQKFAGKVVPKGFVLVSEMNYDWNGHFRYSYSPIGKFSAYIYK